MGALVFSAGNSFLHILFSLGFRFLAPRSPVSATIGPEWGQAASFVVPWRGPPDFLWSLVAPVSFMSLSSRKGAYAVLSSAAWQEIRVWVLGKWLKSAY
jgi:hypothetical protein